MRNYKNTHFNHHRAVLEHFLKVREARLYKLFKFARFGACPKDDYAVLTEKFLENGWFKELKIGISLAMKGC